MVGEKKHHHPPMENRNRHLHKRRQVSSIPLILLLVVCLFSNIIPKASASFFPNVSSIPKDFHRNVTNPWASFHKFAGGRAGNKLDGLSKLKHYFHNLGYLDKDPQNFTDDFDDELKNAVKTYQKFFHLDVTGELDGQTLGFISRPRCGNRDIVNGSTTMESSPSPSPSHAVSHYKIFPGKPRWWKHKLTYAFLDKTLGDDVTAVFARPFAKWAEVIPVSFAYTPSLEDADIKIGFFSGAHGDSFPFDGPLGYLAHASHPQAGHFHLDAAETWIVRSSTGESSSTRTVKSSTGESSSTRTVRHSSSEAFDLESVALHEIGHLLGLDHSSLKESIMYPTIPSRRRKVELAKDDVVGIQSLYGSNPTYHGSEATPSGTSEGGSPRSSLFMWGIAGVFVVAGRHYISRVL